MLAASELQARRRTWRGRTWPARGESSPSRRPAVRGERDATIAATENRAGAVLQAMVHPRQRLADAASPHL